MSVTDSHTYHEMTACLAATRLFETVMIDDVGQAAGSSWPGPLAIISPGPWTDATTDDPALTLRRATYRVTLLVRGDDPRSRLHEADRLSRAVTDLLNGAHFGSGCIPRLSRIDRGECRLSAGSGEATCDLNGTFSYLIPSVSPFNATT